MSRSPFLYPGAPEDPVAWRDGRYRSRAEFLAAVARLAPSLPDRPYVLNHCQDRYCFLVGLAAALSRGQVSLFPSSKASRTIEQLVRDYPGTYCLTDQAEGFEATENVFFPPEPETAGGAAEAPELVFPHEQIVGVAFTSGSTGRPKPYKKTWGGFVREAQVAARALGLEPGGRRHVVATVPAQHMYGFIASIAIPAQLGHVVGADRPFFPEDIRRALERRDGPAILITTPVQLRACVLEKAALPPPAFILSSTAPLHASLAEQAERLFRTRVLEFYGSTETGAIAIRRQAQTQTWRTFDDIRVTRTRQGFTVQAPYFYQSPMVLGDNVEVYNPREFALFGRDAELVKIAGKRISLADLNHQLLAIEGVEDGTFFVPDAEAGGREVRLTAFVVAPSLNKDQVLAALRERIDPVFLPRPLRLVEALPRNDTGKLPRGRLMRLWQQEALG